MYKIFNLINSFKKNKIILFFFLFTISGFIFFQSINLNIKSLLDTYLFIIILFLIFPIIFLLYRVVKQIYNLFFQAKLKIAGYELHKRLAILFSVVCLISFSSPVMTPFSISGKIPSENISV